MSHTAPVEEPPRTFVPNSSNFAGHIELQQLLDHLFWAMFYTAVLLFVDNAPHAVSRPSTMLNETWRWHEAVSSTSEVAAFTHLLNFF